MHLNHGVVAGTSVSCVGFDAICCRVQVVYITLGGTESLIVYPRDFFDTYWRAELRDEVFVAMPFHDEFNPVWDQAIQPAVADSGSGLEARRVDTTVLSGSIITQILDGIAHARLVLADISVATKGKWKGQRNGNVMYEVGLAHAVRQATELLLLRSDDEPLNFDIAAIKVHRYSRSDLTGTRADVSRLIPEVLRQIEQEKSLKVQRAIDLLDTDALGYLRAFGVGEPFFGPDPKTKGDVLEAVSNKAALSRLQQLGIVRAIQLPDETRSAFVATNFGAAVKRALRI